MYELKSLINKKDLVQDKWNFWVEGLLGDGQVSGGGVLHNSTSEGQPWVSERHLTAHYRLNEEATGRMWLGEGGDQGRGV